MRQELKQKLDRQQYRMAGETAAVKLCHWMRQSLLNKRHCYKQEFYGIGSHRCLQMTPVVHDCTHNCIFCWRVRGFESAERKWDSPHDMLDKLIEHQRKLITGFPGDARCDMAKYKEAKDPKHVAISLAGEPTLYPYLGELIEECHKRGMTTFLVTNGTLPEVLERLDPLPSQLYVTVAAPNKYVYKDVCQPRIPDGWERLMRTLELLPSLGTRTVIRHTLVREYNLGWEEEYAKLDERAKPTFIEPKGFVFVGDARQRMSIDNMPSHQEVAEFGQRLATSLGLCLLKEKRDSRVVLLGESDAETQLKFD
ncbi:MAG: 4-demethylwyosine synthase TYW1 [Methanomassiliicoccales archaeon]|jgi:tRNA wybutosine-synthesizing protein 1|nr:4-demethylwyosine synthase TYW1 [Methanomassiliicoccales archaeon]